MSLEQHNESGKCFDISSLIRRTQREGKIRILDYCDSFADYD